MNGQPDTSGSAAPEDESRARLLYCRCAYAQVVPPAVKDAVLEGLTAADRGFEAVPDLCEMAARRDPHLAELARGGRLRIAACWPRAVRGLFALADAPLPEAGVEIFNMRTDAAETVLAGMVATADGAQPPHRPAAEPAAGGGSS